MPKTYDMPRMSDTMEEGTLIKWNVKVGDKVKAGDEVADIETDKATMPMPVYDDGVVAKLVAQPGQALKVGQMILVLAVGKETIEEAAKAAEAGGASGASDGSDGAAASKPAPQPKKEDAAPTTPAAPETATTAVAQEPAASGRQRVSPLARKIAEEKGLDLAHISGTGPEGRIIKRDVEAAQTPTQPSATPGPAGTPSSKSEIRNQKLEIAPTPPPKLESKLIPVSNMRKTIARRLVESKTTIPHFTVTTSVNMESLAGVRKTLNDYLAPQGIKLSVNDFIVRGAALARRSIRASTAPGPKTASSSTARSTSAWLLPCPPKRAAALWCPPSVTHWARACAPSAVRPAPWLKRPAPRG